MNCFVDVLADWVAPVDGDRFKAACRLCGCILRAHYTDLRQHRKTTKHTRNAFWLHNEGREPVSIENNSGNGLSIFTILSTKYLTWW